MVGKLGLLDAGSTGSSSQDSPSELLPDDVCKCSHISYRHLWANWHRP